MTSVPHLWAWRLRRDGSLREDSAGQPDPPLETSPRGLFCCREPDRRRPHRPRHPARGVPPPARRPGWLVPPRIGGAGPTGAALLRRLGVAAAHAGGGGAV